MAPWSSLPGFRTVRNKLLLSPLVYGIFVTAAWADQDSDKLKNAFGKRGSDFVSGMDHSSSPGQRTERVQWHVTLQGAVPQWGHRSELHRQRSHAVFMEALPAQAPKVLLCSVCHRRQNLMGSRPGQQKSRWYTSLPKGCYKEVRKKSLKPWNYEMRSSPYVRIHSLMLTLLLIMSEWNLILQCS